VASLARWCFRNRRIVIALWVVAFVGFLGAARQAGSVTSNNFRLPNTDSQAGNNLLKAAFPAQSGDTEQIVLAVRSGKVTDPAIEARVDAMLGKVRLLPHVRAVSTPYTPRTVSRDGTIAIASVILDGQPQDIPKAAVTALISTAQAAESPALQVQLGGQAVQQAERTNSGGSSELIGGILALIVLYIAFGAFFAALMPLLSAVIAIVIGTSLIALLSHVMSIAGFADQLSVLIGLGVGVDYALFIITRHRAGLMAGRDIEQSAVTAVNTSGRAVFFAGIVVCIALLGQFALGVSFLYGVALSAAFTVLLTMGTALTLLPAMLGVLGPRVLSRRERRRLTREGPRGDATSGFWYRWSGFVASRSLPLALASLAVIVALALPVFSLHLGLSDSGNDPKSTTTRQAYDLLAKGFGPGQSGPLEIVGAINGPGDTARFDAILAAVARQPGVVSVGAPRVAPRWRWRCRAPRPRPRRPDRWSTGCAAR
jgi:putative drug exporter of the RND superfamily